MLLAGIAGALDQGDQDPPSGTTGTSTSTSTGSDTASCRFLRASLADFQAPNPPPITNAEQVEYAAIRSQMADEDC